MRTNQPSPTLHIDLDCIEHNIDLISRTTGKDVQDIVPVVKNSAYGLGNRIIAPFLQDLGIRDFAVATLEEADFLRSVGIRGDILILENAPSDSLAHAHHKGFTLSLVDRSQLSPPWTDYACPLALNIDTGMHRNGFTLNDLTDPEVAAALRRMAARISTVYTHFHSADGPDRVPTDTQISQFSKASRILAELGINGYRTHISNSAGSLFYPCNGADALRPGVAVYGCSPDPAYPVENLKCAASVTSHVSSLRCIQAGESLSYGHIWTNPARTRIATIPMGYSDGYPRALSAAGAVVRIGKKHYPVVGRVTMDYIMVDLGTDTCTVGDTAVISEHGTAGLSMDDLALKAGTIGYELLCRFGTSLRRVYYRKGKVRTTHERNLF
ncbi:MAG: alanine racemase [Fibrobacterota bacterium]